MSRLWDKGVSVNEQVLKFTVGNDHLLDARLVAFDVQASSAHARMLEQCGYLEAGESEKLAAALSDLGASHAAGEWSISLEEEDCHTALENRLTERLGVLGGRIHLGRSRNDQVLAALRLYLLSEIHHLVEGAQAVIAALAKIINDQGAVPLPGYTHQQRAMPSSVGDWAGAFKTELEDDIEGLNSCWRRLSKNPLGSAAGYGVPVLGLDRTATQEALGFTSVQEPVTAVQLSRGKAEAQVVFESALLMQDLGRLASDLCLFATEEFGFVRLPDAFTTGSSIMPQKRNPDVFELVRGRAAQVPAELQAVFAITEKMTSGYHRDLQLLKPPLFRVLDSTDETLRVMASALQAVRFDPEVCQRALSAGLFATEKAYRMVKDQGVSFREAYRIVGRDFTAKAPEQGGGEAGLTLDSEEP